MSTDMRAARRQAQIEILETLLRMRDALAAYPVPAVEGLLTPSDTEPQEGAERPSGGQPSGETGHSGTNYNDGIHR